MIKKFQKISDSKAKDEITKYLKKEQQQGRTTTDVVTIAKLVFEQLDKDGQYLKR